MPTVFGFASVWFDDFIDILSSSSDERWLETDFTGEPDLKMIQRILEAIGLNSMGRPRLKIKRRHWHRPDINRKGHGSFQRAARQLQFCLGNICSW